MAATTNAERSAEEVRRFKAGEHHDTYFAYQSGPAFRPRGERGWAIGRTITTWTGDKLADVIDAGDVWTDNFGSKRQCFRARGIDGRTYAGTAFLSAGDYVHMRPVKS